MLLMVGVFLLNLLCGLVPCNPRFEQPQVRTLPFEIGDIARNIANENVEAVVKLPNYGILEGYHMKSMNGRTIFAFEGIPYAESAGGRRRWKPPVPKRPWRGFRQAKKPGQDCLQISFSSLLRVYGSEDCLYLNIYTPYLPSSVESLASLPVVIYIHGGSFILGSGSEYGPSYILNEDVIYVNINYRLGVLGFLSTGDSVLPGNYGLKDQSLAIKWVHENIARFGGNPRNISLWGNSSGGVSVHLHLISNKTRNFFSTALSSSSTAFQSWSIQTRERTRYLANRLGERFGCQNEDTRRLIQCLERIDSNSLVAAQLSLFDWFPFPVALFTPVVEPEDPQAFLTMSPEVAYKTGAVAKKPFVVGTLKDEGKTMILVLIALMRIFPLRYMWKQIAPVFLNYKDFVKSPNQITRQIEELYFQGKSPREVSYDDFSNMVSDRYLKFGAVTGAQAHASLNASTYFYYFSFSEGNHNLANAFGFKSSEWGVGHTEDMFYLFNNSLAYNGQKESDPDHELSSIMINLLVNFAATGEPQYKSSSGQFIRLWEPVVQNEQVQVLELNKEIKMIPFPENEINRLNFWNGLNLPHLKLWEPLVGKK